MTTLRQIERLLNGKSWHQLVRELLHARPEASVRAETDLTRPAPAAALAMIRLDELSQGHAPLYPRLLRIVLAAQEADGGWGDAVVTAVCLRALLCGRGDGAAIERGLTYLTHLQKTEGAWPRVPIRRMPEDAYSSAFVMFQLGGEPRFRERVRFGQAVDWFEQHADRLDAESRRLWTHARFRCRTARPERLLAGA